jgi:hypothetical protein
LNQDGSVGSPAYSFASAGNSDNGMYLSNANEVSFATSGAQRLKLHATGQITSLVDFLGNGYIKSNATAGGIGYDTGAGGSVTQTTNKSTSVTLEHDVRQITMNKRRARGWCKGHVHADQRARLRRLTAWSHGSRRAGRRAPIAWKLPESGGFVRYHAGEHHGGLAHRAIVIGFAVIKAVTS